MSLNINLNDLNLENIGSWPYAVKATLCSLLAIFLMMLIYYIDASAQLDVLNRYQQNEQQLRQSFEKKYYQAASLRQYKEQLAVMRVSLGNMLNQLPSREEVPGLLEEISKSGKTSGLEFKLFDPANEIGHEFYAELPIQIVVNGDYHQFGDFVSRVASLGRIVTLHDLDIKIEQTHSKQNEKENTVGKANNLEMVITAKTYRYSEDMKKDVGNKDEKVQGKDKIRQTSVKQNLS